MLRLSTRGCDWLEQIDAGAPLPPGDASAALARRLVDSGSAHPVPSPHAGPTASEVAIVVPVRDDVEGLRLTLAALQA